MRLLLFIVLLLILGRSAYAVVNLSTTWTEDGGYKMARQDTVPIPNCSSCTISRIWDGKTISLFGGKGELLHWVTYLIGGASDATNVMVTISSFTGTGSASGFGIVSVNVSSTAVWDYTNRPITLYKYGYVQEVGMNKNGPWDPTEYEIRQEPIRWRVPCTVNGNNDCVANGGTDDFLHRNDHDKFYPDPAVPIEEFGISSFTVAASSSQAIGGELYISTGLPSGTYTGFMTVWENGVTASTSIPMTLKVYNFTMPTVDTVTVIAYVGISDLSDRLNGNRFPASYFVEPYLTSAFRSYSFLHRHHIVPIGDTPGTQDYPSIEYQKLLDGSAYTGTYGVGDSVSSPGFGKADTFYSIGTYGGYFGSSWSSTTVTNGSGTGYCDNVSSWTYYCVNHGVNCAQYTSNDEASQGILALTINRISTWNSTAPACAYSGHTMPFNQTGQLPNVLQAAPYVNFILSTTWLGFSSTTWQTYENQLSTTTGDTAGGYNSSLPGTDSLYAIQEAGVGPREVLWGALKGRQKYWFAWQVNYWNDANNPGQAFNGWNTNEQGENDVLAISKTFGYDNFPATSAVLGHTGPSFANGDGNMLYPGFDAVYSTQSYGFNGVIGSWRLNQLDRGIQDADIWDAAYKVNPTSATAIMANLVGNTLWLTQCFTLADCSYAYGDRPFTENGNTYELARESLEQMLDAAAQSSEISGQAILKGSVIVK